jgi:hypothetical protein
LVRRARGERAEAACDRALLGFVARFRSVTAELLAERLGVSWERVNGRVRRWRPQVYCSGPAWPAAPARGEERCAARA